MVTAEMYYEEMRKEFTMWLDGEDIFQEQYLSEGENVREYYRDFAPTLTGYKGMTFNSFFTPHYISKMDRWMANRIKEGQDCEYSKEELTTMIRNNPNLHNVIKTNLLNNLKAWDA